MIINNVEKILENVILWYLQNKQEMKKKNGVESSCCPFRIYKMSLFSIYNIYFIK